MSTQRGNVNKAGPPKYCNRTSFRNDLHDSSHKTKIINKLDISGVCQRCKDVIDWKIKYKKYKPLTVPKKCVKCGEKSVKTAYFTICAACSGREKVCGKCGQKGDLVERSSESDKVETGGVAISEDCCSDSDDCE